MTLQPVPRDVDRPMVLHHVALCPADFEASVRFYRDGLGFEPIMDEEIPGGWKGFFDARSDNLRSVFFGDRERPDAGIVELVMFDGGQEDAPPSGPPAAGFFLLSFVVDVDATLARLAALGLDTEARVVSNPEMGTNIARVRDPDGVLIELIPFGVVSDGPIDLGV